MKASWYATAVFGVSAVAGIAIRPMRYVAVAVAVALFVAGAVMMAMALVIAARRSREVVIDVGQLFFSVPKPLLWSLAVQVAIAFATAPIRRSAAFGILAPVAGLGFCGLWAARHREFPSRKA